MPIAINGFLLKPAGGSHAIKEAPFAVVMPLCVTAGLCFVLFFLMPYVYDFLLLLNLR